MERYQETVKDVDLFRQLVGDKLFDCDFDLLFKELSIKSSREYIDWLSKAFDEICKCGNPYVVLSHYDVILQDFKKR